MEMCTVVKMQIINWSVFSGMLRSGWKLSTGFLEDNDIMFHTKTNIDFLNLENQMFLCTLGCAEVMTSCCLENNQGKSYHSLPL